MSNVLEATHLITPLLDRKYKLTLVGETKIDGRPATGVRVSRQGFRDLTLYFDRQTHLLVKMERRGLDPLTHMQCQEARLYKDYQKREGRMVPGSVSLLRDGGPTLEFHILDYTILNDVPAEEFARPQRQ
jgi:hypothetical protein